MAQFAPIFDVVIEDVNVDLRATFDSVDKYGMSGSGTTAFQKVIFRLAVKSPSPQEQVRQLIEHSERGCHAAQSLRNPVPVEMEFSINGKKVPS